MIASSVSLQLAVIGLIIGIIVISVVYRKFSFWIKTQKFNHTRPHVARFARKIILPFLAIALISSVNMYIQVFELFDEESAGIQLEGELAPSEVFAKMLNTLNILVIGYTISQLVPIALTKRDSSVLERQDFEAWREMRGFPDDADDFFHKLYKWIPPKQKPDDLTDEESERLFCCAHLLLLLKSPLVRTILLVHHRLKWPDLVWFQQVFLLL